MFKTDFIRARSARHARRACAPLAWLICCVFWPTAAGIICLMLLCVALARALVIDRLAARGAAAERALDATPPSTPSSPTPRVLVLLATCREPPRLVIRTLDALAALPQRDLSVVVVDNNTPDPALWRPVEAHVERLGARFDFIHVDRLAGAKAGALHLGLAHAGDADFVAVVDADYAVHPRFLTDALAAFASAPPRTGFVQHPQDYRDLPRRAPAVHAELGDFFATTLRAAERLGAPLPTGTLTVYRREALRAVGDFGRATSITEDAEIGVALLAAGWTGRFIPRARGAGVGPLSLRCLRTQRRRWAAGNRQVLAASRRLRLPLPQRLAVELQLTHWHTFAAVWLTAALLAPLAALGSATTAAFMATCAAGALLGEALIWLMRAGPRVAAVRLTMQPEHAVNALRSCAELHRAFVVTAKHRAPDERPPRLTPATATPLALGLCSAAFALLGWAGPAALLTSLLIAYCGAARWVERCLDPRPAALPSSTREHTRA